MILSCVSIQNIYIPINNALMSILSLAGNGPM